MAQTIEVGWGMLRATSIWAISFLKSVQALSVLLTERPMAQVFSLAVNTQSGFSVRLLPCINVWRISNTICTQVPAGKTQRICKYLSTTYKEDLLIHPFPKCQPSDGKMPPNLVPSIAATVFSSSTCLEHQNISFPVLTHHSPLKVTVCWSTEELLALS